MKTINNIYKSIKNINRFYVVGVFWALWLSYITPMFVGDLSLIVFFIGFCVTLCLGGYVADNLNAKELKMVEKLYNFLKEGEDEI